MYRAFDQRIVNLQQLLLAQARMRGDQVAFRFVNYEGGEDESLTYAQLDQRARAIAFMLRQKGLSRQRVLLLYPSGLDFICGMFGCFYANAIAVPAYPPSLSRPDRALPRIMAIIDDAKLEYALTSGSIAASASAFKKKFRSIEKLTFLTTDVLDTTLSNRWSKSQIDQNSQALLQYTSGSTGKPKGVILTHANILHNQTMIFDTSFVDGNNFFTSWLPPYHDMGLIGGILFTLYVGTTCCLMSPRAFLRKPIRWLETISKYRATYSPSPSFGLQLAVRRTTEAQRQGLDLSSWKVCYNGSEPVSARVIDEFVRTFEPYGFKREAIYPCYGMAEATLFISGGDVESAPVVRSFDVDAFTRGVLQQPQDGNVRVRTLVSCGRAATAEEIRIVDPETREECAQGRVGEIWVKSPSVAIGYWQRPHETASAFSGFLLPNNEGPYLRTGDLGALLDGELFITGRLKDLIIIRGMNHHPQDIENTVQDQHPALCRNGGAAFSIEIDGQEKPIVVQELDRREPYDLEKLIPDILRAIGEQHDLAVHELVLIKRGSLFKTSSGKIQRKATREAYLADKLEVAYRWRSNQGDQPKAVDRLEAESYRVDKCSDSLKTRTQSDATFERQSVGGAPTARQISLWLRRAFSKIVELPVQQVDTSQPLSRYGLDSVSAAELAEKLQHWLGRAIDPEVVYDYPSIEALADHLAGCSRKDTGTEEISRANRGDRSSLKSDEPIAIIGMACRFPDANDVESYWDLLRYGLDAVREIPSDRWNLQEFFHPSDRQQGKMNTRWGGFLERIDEFDAGFFGIAPREAEQMDPQQRLLMEVVWEALERAGIAASSLSGSDSGVFVGISSSDYPRLYPHDYSLVDAHFATGNAHSIAANRLSYFFDLCGPSMAIDTACSSSLTALHSAIGSLRSGECNLAIVGGVNAILSPEMMIGFSHAGTLSPDGCCRAFDASASGFSRSEGVGALILKRLSQAKRDGDTICALVRGSAVTHDGRSNGLTAPRGPAQQRTIRFALRNADVKPEEVSYVEAHGSGTLIGDAIELKALGAVLNRNARKDERCWVSSAKTNFGSMEAASGMAAVIKTVLALQHEEIPPHLHFREPNPDIPFDALGLKIPTVATPWRKGEKKRIAGVSSFAFGGSNAHVVLEEAPNELRTSTNEGLADDRPFHLLCLSAKHPESLRRLAYVYSKKSDRHALADLCFSANTGRDHFDYRLAVVFDEREQLRSCLREFAECDAPQTIALRQGQTRQANGPVWLFGSENDVPIGRGKALLQSEPRFRQAFCRSDEIIKDYLGESIVDRVVSPRVQSDPLSPVLASVYAFALGDALADLWTAWGLAPTAVIGEGVGECVAAHRAGVLSKADAIRLVCQYAIARYGDPERPCSQSCFQPVEPKPSQVPFISAWVDERFLGGTIPWVESWIGKGSEQTHLDDIYALLKTMQPCFVQQTWPTPIGDKLSGQLIDLQIATVFAPEYEEWESLLLCLATQYVSGFSVDWVSFDQPFTRNRVVLPTYPFQRQRYWLRVSEESRRPVVSYPPSARSSHPLIHRRSSRPVSSIESTRVAKELQIDKRDVNEA